MTEADFNAALDGINVTTDKIGAEVDDLRGQLQTGGLNKQEEQRIFDRLGVLAIKLTAVAKDPADPTGEGGGTVGPQPPVETPPADNPGDAPVDPNAPPVDPGAGSGDQ